MLERDEIRKVRIKIERLRWQKVEALAKAVRHRSYRVRNEDIADALIRDSLKPRRERKNNA